MDAHVFSSLAHELAVFLQGARIEKIYGPLPHTWVFSLFAQKRKVKLLFSAQANNPCMCLTSQTLENPQNPRADVMYLRKYIAGKRLGRGYVHAPSRRMAFAVSLGPDGPVHYLLFSWKDSLKLVPELPGAFFERVSWPKTWVAKSVDAGGKQLDEHFSPQPLVERLVEPLAEPLGEALVENHDLAKPLWEQYGVLTPLLRGVLAEGDAEANKQLLASLSLGRGVLHVYVHKEKEYHASLFPLPAAMLARKGWAELSISPGLCAGALVLKLSRPQAPLQKGAKAAGAVNSLTCEAGVAKIPLGGCAASLNAEIVLPVVQATPYFPEHGVLPQDGKTGLAVLPHGSHSALHGGSHITSKFGDAGDAEVQECEEPGVQESEMLLSLSVLCWMEEHRFFSALATVIDRREKQPERREAKKKARLQAKLEQEKKRLQAMADQRGTALLLQINLWQLDATEKRAKVVLHDASTGEEHHITLQAERTVKENMEHMFHQSARGQRGLIFLENRQSHPGQVRSREKEPVQPAGKEARLARYGALNRKNPARKDVARFTSTEGFVVFRGKNAEGNKNIVKMGQPHDIWLHSKDGPSAHVLIRRNNDSHTVPEQTLNEAAILVGLKSWQRQDRRAEIMYAEMRHVRGHKGRYAGAVLADKLLGTVVVELQAELEMQLAQEEDT